METVNFEEVKPNKGTYLFWALFPFILGAIFSFSSLFTSEKATISGAGAYALFIAYSLLSIYIPWVFYFYYAQKAYLNRVSDGVFGTLFIAFCLPVLTVLILSIAYFFYEPPAGDAGMGVFFVIVFLIGYLLFGIVVAGVGAFTIYRSYESERLQTFFANLPRLGIIVAVGMGVGVSMLIVYMVVAGLHL